MTRQGDILIVDDDSNSLALLSSLLTAEGHTVRPADSGKLALASVEASPPELILLDMRMPGMDGLAVCRQLKARKESRNIPVLFISGSTGADARVEALELGAVDFLTKPFNRAELLARVRTHLELSRLRSQLEEQVALRTAELRSTVEQLQREIGERWRIEQALRESERRFRIMADTAPVMIVASDADRRATFFNKVWRDFTGHTMEQDLGTGWTASVHADDLQNCLNSIAASYAKRKECLVRYRVRRADGEYRFVMCKGVPRFEPDGTFAGYIGSLVDITDLKRNQEALEEYQQRLQELTAGLLTAQENVSRELAREIHDVFSQELASVGVQIFALREESKSDGNLVGRLSDLGNRLVRLAQDLHRTSRELHPGVLDDLGLKPALADECDAFQERSGIATRFTAENVPEGLPGDVSLCLYRIVQESLRNIGKHAADSSMVRVSVSGSPQRVVLRIEDNGEGFDPAGARKKGGLGLISMEERVRLVSGSLSLRSELGKGSTVEVVVPLGPSTSKDPADHPRSVNEKADG
jgi:PAS domain S-box-containing protein